MVVTKVAISLPPDVVHEIRALAERDGESFSGWLAEAAARRLRHERLGKLNKQLEEEFGPVDPELLEAVEREWLQ